MAVALLCGLGVLAAVLVLLTISLGAVRVPLSEVVQALIGEPTREESWTYLVRELRAPRALTALHRVGREPGGGGSPGRALGAS